MAYKKRYEQMQNLQKCIRTNAELTKVHSDKCRTYKSRFGQMQNLQKFHSDKCRTYKSPFGQMQNLQKFFRTNAEITKIDSNKRQLNDSEKRSFPAKFKVIH